MRSPFSNRLPCVIGFKIRVKITPGVDGGPPSRGIIDLIANLGGIHIISCLHRLDLGGAMQVIE